jgi:ketosteroid isomerase-like protein
MPDPARLQRALDAIDAANADDPNVVTVRDRTGPKEVVHAELVSEWIERLRPAPSDALRLAARGHHFRRWTSPRASQPTGRAGYLRWRKALYAQQASELAEILRAEGYDDEMIGAVRSLVRKERLGRDADADALEDALCLVFLETQLADVAARLEPDTLQRVIVKSAKKMTGAGRAFIPEVPLPAPSRRVLDEALALDTVARYLDAMAAADWPALRATLAPAVHRIGPYRDVFDGRDAYADFLEATITSLSGYQLAIVRLLASGSTVSVELNETVDDKGARLHTDEVVVFDVTDGEITNVAVYLQTSERQTSERT